MIVARKRTKAKMMRMEVKKHKKRTTTATRNDQGSNSIQIYVLTLLSSPSSRKGTFLFCSPPLHHFAGQRTVLALSIGCVVILLADNIIFSFGILSCHCGRCTFLNHAPPTYHSCGGASSFTYMLKMSSILHAILFGVVPDVVPAAAAAVACGLVTRA